MKIAVVVNELDIRGGTHKQILRLCQYLKKQKVDFVLCSKYYDLDKTYPEFGEFDIRYLQKHTVPRERSGRNVKKKLDNFLFEIQEQRDLFDIIPKDVDVVNVHDNGLEYVMWWAKKAGKKVAWQINDLNYVFSVGVTKQAKVTLPDRIKRILFRSIAQKVDAITVNVTKNAERVRKCLRKDATVLYCGVDANHALLKHSFREGGKEFRLLSMGVFLPYRNYETLLEVINQLRKRGKNIRLDIIGSTQNKNYTEKIQELISQNEITDYVKIWGQVDDAMYNELFNRADAFAFVNIDQSWGLAVFEAMSGGIPTIVSNSVGATELLHDNVDSIIVDPLNVEQICNVIERLMTDRAYYERLSDSAYAVTKDYTWDHMYSSKLVDIMKQL